MEDGTFWFPTQGGVAVVDTRAVRTDDREPPVLVEAFHLDGDAVAFRDGVTAGPDRNSFEIRYTAMSFVKPEQIRFRYRLVGLDDHWVDAYDRRTATYYRIPSGRYEFQVAAANGDGEWSRRPARVSIVVLAPVWQRAWFLALTGVAVAALIVAVDRRRAARLRWDHERQHAYARQLLEAQEKERRRISNDLHDSLGQSLMLIRAQARSAGNGHGVHDPALDTIASLAGKAYDDMKAIAYDLRPYQLDKVGVSRTLDGMLKRIDQASSVAVESDIAIIDDVVPSEAAIHVYRIVQEAVNNIVRHSGATHARVSVRRDAEGVEIEIADNGHGLQTPPEPAANGTLPGFGLMGIEERVRSLKGNVALRSSPGTGTTLRVRFPFVERTDD